MQRCNFYDRLVERFSKRRIRLCCGQRGHCVSSRFWTYLLESDVLTVLREAGRRVFVHIPISGGEMLNDSLLGFRTLAETAAEKSLVVWINEYFGPIASEGKTFDQMQVYLDNRERVLTSIGVPRRSPDTFSENIRKMRERKLTFSGGGRDGPPASGCWKGSACAWCAGTSSNNWNRRRLREVSYGSSRLNTS